MNTYLKEKIGLNKEKIKIKNKKWFKDIMIQ
jgi:hypothetical protein